MGRLTIREMLLFDTLVAPSCWIENIPICTMNSEQLVHRLSSDESWEEFWFAVRFSRWIIRDEGFFRKCPLVFFIDHFTVEYLIFFLAIFVTCIRMRAAVKILILESIVASSRTERWKSFLWQSLSLNRVDAADSSLHAGNEPCTDTMFWVSSNRDEDTLMTHATRSKRTWLIFNALARCISPSASISLYWISSVVRLCEWKEGSLYDELSSEKRRSLTRLIFKASARYSTPSFPNWLCPTSNVVRVCEENERVLLVVVVGSEDISSYLINLQSIRKMTSTFTTHAVSRNPQFSECLRTVLRWMKKKKRARCSLTWLIVNASLIHLTPASPIRLDPRLSETSVC